ncbi:MAG: hypothetical protein J7J76_09540 [Candidatus Latescibacteria bacterium]|nr:hypothetical protein [Candidatus Latescibacterota bacterium]
MIQAERCATICGSILVVFILLLIPTFLGADEMGAQAGINKNPIQIKKMRENEDRILSTLEMLYNSFEQYKVTTGHYPNNRTIDELEALKPYPRIKEDLLVRRKNGYFFAPSAYWDFWYCYAWPTEYGITGRKSFYVDDTGVWRQTDKKFSGIQNPARSKDAEYWSIGGKFNR